MHDLLQSLNLANYIYFLHSFPLFNHPLNYWIANVVHVRAYQSTKIPFHRPNEIKGKKINVDILIAGI